VVHRTRRLHAEDRALVDGMPVTSVARTLVDLAEALATRPLSRAVHQAEISQLFDLRGVTRALERVPGRAGRHQLRRVLAGYEPEGFTRSEAERRFLQLCRRHGLPPPRTNTWLEGHEVDFLWEDARLVVEVDGAAFHDTRRAFHADRRRDRALAALGFQIVRITWRDLEKQERQVAGELRAILGRAR